MWLKKRTVTENLRTITDPHGPGAGPTTFFSLLIYVLSFLISCVAVSLPRLFVVAEMLMVSPLVRNAYMSRLISCLISLVISCLINPLSH